MAGYRLRNPTHEQQQQCGGGGWMGGRLRGGGGFIHPRAPRVRTNPYFRRIHKRGVRNPVSNIGTNEPPISVTRTERVPWTGTRCPPNRTSLRSSLPHTLTDPASHHPVRRLTESETRLGLTENAARKLGTNRERGVTETARVRTIRRKRAGERQRRRERERSRSYGGALARRLQTASLAPRPSFAALSHRIQPILRCLCPSVNAQTPHRFNMDGRTRSLVACRLNSRARPLLFLSSSR